MNSAENQSNPFTSNCSPRIQLASFVCPMSLLPLLQIISVSVMTEYRHPSSSLPFIILQIPITIKKSHTMTYHDMR